MSVSRQPGSVTVRLFAAARAAAGTDEVVLPAGELGAVLESLCSDRPPALAQVLSISTLLCDGVRLDPAASTRLPAGSVVDVLPPFAGG